MAVSLGLSLGSENVEERELLPGGVADGAEVERLVLDAREVKRVGALGCENGRTLSAFNALQADSASTLEKEEKKTGHQQKVNRNINKII